MNKLFSATFILLTSATFAFTQNQEAIKWMNLGNQQGQAKDFNAAIRSFSNCIKIENKAATCYFGRGFSYFQLQQFDNAIEDFSMAIRLNPNYGDAYLGRIRAYCFAGKVDLSTADEKLYISKGGKLEDTCKNFLAQNPQFVKQNTGNNSAQKLLAEGQEKEKERTKLLSQIVGKSSETNKTAFDKYYALDTDISNLYSKAIKENPKFGEAYLARANLNAQSCTTYGLKSDFESALKYLPEKNNSIYSDRAIWYSYLLELPVVKLTNLAEKYKEDMFADLKRSGRTDIPNSLTSKYLTSLRINNGFNGANPCLSPDDSEIYKLHDFYSQKKYKEAESVLKRIQESKTKSVGSYTLLKFYSGLVNNRLGNYEISIKDLSSVIESGIDFLNPKADPLMSIQMPSITNYEDGTIRWSPPQNIEYLEESDPEMIAYLERGKAYLETQKYRDAYMDFTNYYDKFRKIPKGSSSILLPGTLSDYATEEQKAESKILKAKTIPILKLRAKAYCLAGNKDSAKSDEKTVIELGGKIETPCQ